MNESRENDTWMNQASRDARATALGSQSQSQNELKWLSVVVMRRVKQQGKVLDLLLMLHNNLRSYDAFNIIYCVVQVLEDERGGGVGDFLKFVLRLRFG